MTGQANPLPVEPHLASDAVVLEKNMLRRPRYSATNQLFHWITALLMAVILVLGWIMVSAGAKPAILPVWEWHKTLGIVVLIITASRLLWRFVDPPPPATHDMPRWTLLLSRLTCALFFLGLLIMPVSGYLLSAGAGHPPILFNIIETPAIVQKDLLTFAIGKTVHLAGQWIIYALILLHLAGVVFHVAIRRDRTLERMLPEPRDQ